MVLAVLALSAWVLSPMELVLVARAGRATALYVANFWWLRESSDYFATGTDTTPLLHVWSLSVEEQFYIAWPIIIVLARRHAPSPVRLLWLLGALAGVSLSAAVYWTPRDQLLAFYGTHFRTWEFGLGGLAALAPATFRNVFATTTHSRAIAWIGLALVLGSAIAYDPQTLFPGIAAVPPLLGVLSVLLASNGPSRSPVPFLNGPAVQRIGTLSVSAARSTSSASHKI